MRAWLAGLAVAAASCIGGGGDPGEDPCNGANPGLRIRPMPRPGGPECAPEMFQQVTITVSSLGSTDATFGFGGASEYRIAWPVGTVPDVPGLVSYQAYYGNGEGRGMAPINTAPDQCLPVDLIFDCL